MSKEKKPIKVAVIGHHPAEGVAAALARSLYSKLGNIVVNVPHDRSAYLKGIKNERPDFLNRKQ